jgi:hypothetical protein
MKTQITKTLELNDGRYLLDGELVLCGSFVQAFFPNQDLPAQVKVSASIRSWAFKGAKRVWIRHHDLGITYPSSWTWEKDGNEPANFDQGGGMYSVTGVLVTELLGEKFGKLSPHWGDVEGKEGIRVPVYVRVVKA